MDRLLYIAASGANQDMVGLATRGNNLANANTTAFKADMEQARTMQAYGEGLPTRVFAMEEGYAQKMTSGNLKTTQRPLDVAVNGNGWLSVQSPTGDEAYTRDGNLRISNTGLLEDNKGNLILGDNGPVAIPLPYQKVDIGQDGTISVVPQGAPPNAIEVVGRLKLVAPDNSEMVKGNDGLFRTKAGEPVDADAQVTLVVGALEQSNVNVVEEMTRMIELQRHFETQVKMMKTAEELDSASASLLSMR